MGLFDSITGWLKRERADIGAALGDLESDLDANLSRKERELTATPEERIEMLNDEIDDDPFSAVRDRIESATAKADAVDELATPEDTDASPDSP